MLHLHHLLRLLRHRLLHRRHHLCNHKCLRLYLKLIQRFLHKYKNSLISLRLHRLSPPLLLHRLKCLYLLFKIQHR